MLFYFDMIWEFVYMYTCMALAMDMCVSLASVYDVLAER